jgi:hypothetical protein
VHAAKYCAEKGDYTQNTTLSLFWDAKLGIYNARHHTHTVTHTRTHRVQASLWLESDVAAAAVVATTAAVATANTADGAASAGTEAADDLSIQGEC